MPIDACFLQVASVIALALHSETNIFGNESAANLVFAIVVDIKGSYPNEQGNFFITLSRHHWSRGLFSFIKNLFIPVCK